MSADRMLELIKTRIPVGTKVKFGFNGKMYSGWLGTIVGSSIFGDPEPITYYAIDMDTEIVVRQASDIEVINEVSTIT